MNLTLELDSMILPLFRIYCGRWQQFRYTQCSDFFYKTFFFCINRWLLVLLLWMVSRLPTALTWRLES